MMDEKIRSSAPEKSPDRHPQSENYVRMMIVLCGTVITLVILVPLVRKITKDSTVVELIDYLKSTWSYIGCSAVSVIIDRQFIQKSHE